MNESTPLEVQPRQAGHKVWPVAYSVDPNEKALLLIERNENRPDYRGFRRYQTIFVARHDRLAKYMEDMGPSEAFIAPELDVPGGDPGYPLGEWWETVAALQDYASDFRVYLAERQLEREIADLKSGYHDLIDKDARRRVKLSQFGPVYTVQRG
jgi:hypothetical protein|tara:strand:+ start:572 stop:1033 length:462 start_codon:yes stop_codon:yes gene_type:complete